MPCLPSPTRCSLYPKVVKGYMELGAGYVDMLSTGTLSLVVNKVRI